MSYVIGYANITKAGEYQSLKICFLPYIRDDRAWYPGIAALSWIAEHLSGEANPVPV